MIFKKEPLNKFDDTQVGKTMGNNNIWYLIFIALSVYILIESIFSMILHFATLEYRDYRTFDIQPIPNFEKLSLILEDLDIITFLAICAYMIYSLIWFCIVNLDKKSRLMMLFVATVGIGFFPFFFGFNMFALLFD